MKLALLAFGLALLCPQLTAVAHDHYAAGVQDTNGNGQPDAGEPLAFAPAGSAAGDFTTGGDGTGKTYHLCPRPFGYRPTQRCGGYYVLDENARTLFPADSFSFIVLSDGSYTGVVDPGHAHGGAWLWMEIVSVTGPEGGQFGFWDADTSRYNDTPTVTFFANQPISTRTPTDLPSPTPIYYPFTTYPSNRFILSEGYNAAGEDPAGHIHERSWTATKPGDYYVGMRLIDLSTNGPSTGGRWHSPSQIYTYHFQAGPSFKPTVQWGAGNKMTMTWPSLMGTNNGLSQPGIAFQIERATSLSPANWTVIGTVTGTTAATATFTDNNPPAGQAYYRRKFTWSVPQP